MSTTIRVVCAIIERRGQILVTRRGSGRRALLWEFPGGKLETGETAAQGIIREIREELGMRIRPLAFLPALRWRYPDTTIIMTPVIARHTGGRLVLREHTAAQWITPKESVELEWCAADSKVLERYLQRQTLDAKVSARARAIPARRKKRSR